MLSSRQVFDANGDEASDIRYTPQYARDPSSRFRYGQRRNEPATRRAAEYIY